MSHLKFIPSLSGPLRIWQHPLQGREYVIGADVAEHKERATATKGRRIVNSARGEGDSSAAAVLDVESCVLVAMWCAQMDTNSFAQQLLALGTYYNTATVAVEVTGPGRGVQDYLANSAYYPNCWVNNDTYVRLKGKASIEYGWKTNVMTRPIMVSNAQLILSDPHCHVSIPDADLLREMSTMEHDKKSGKERAGGNNKDDRVFAWMIALEVRRQMLLQAIPTMDEIDEKYEKVAPKDREFRRRLDKMREVAVQEGGDGYWE